MRDPNRIFPLCNKFAGFWQTYYPDLRFQQVIDLLATFMKEDPFYAEDDEWAYAIDRASNQIKSH